MKKFALLTITFTLLISCGQSKSKSVDEIISSGNVEQINELRIEIAEQQSIANEKLKKIDEALGNFDTNKKLPLVTTITTKPEAFNHFVELQGNVKTKQNIVIYPEVPGILKQVLVKEGQKVSKGQVLAIIDDGGLEQQVAQLEIQANLAKTTFERQQRLWDQKIGSEMDYLQSKSSYEAQEKAVTQSKIQLEKTKIRAPFSGVIDDVITEQGSVVSPGQSQILRIVNLDNMYIEVDVPESYIKDVTKNKKVIVELPILGESIETKIRQAGNFINPANRTFKIEVSVPNKNRNIKPNLTAKLKINDYKNDSAILIPQSIISENANGEQYIYIANGLNENKEATTEKVIITTGKTQGDIIEVLSGVESGFTIIKEGARSVRDGQTVKVLNQ